MSSFFCVRAISSYVTTSIHQYIPTDFPQNACRGTQVVALWEGVYNLFKYAFTGIESVWTLYSTIGIELTVFLNGVSA